MKRRLFAVASVIGLVASMQAGESGGDMGANADHYMQALVARRHFSGVAIIARGGKVLFAHSYGLANFEDAAPNSMQTKFRIGSLTKQFTATAVMILQDRGKLALNDSICKYVEACPSAWQPITITNLLTHSSGLPNYTTFRDIGRMKRTGMTPKTLLEELRTKALDFAPGEKFAYSNSGYSVLGYVIEKVSGVSYADFLEKNIFAPLDMKSSGYDSPAVLPRRAAGYVWKDHQLWNADYTSCSSVATTN